MAYSKTPITRSLICIWLLLLNVAGSTTARSEDDEDIRPLVSAEQYAADLAARPVLTVIPEVRHGTLLSLRDAWVPPFYGPKRVHYEGLGPILPGSQNQIDGALQSSMPAPAMPTATQDFFGMGNTKSPSVITGTPPDTDGAVGRTQYVQVVNGGIAVFDKTGNVLVAPKLLNVLWTGFAGTDPGNGCATRNDGDPIVVYDKAADRWVVSQFSVPHDFSTPTKSGPDYQCIAVSQTSDAGGAWNLYEFQYSYFNDYPKMGVWPDGYYVTFNNFGTSYKGADLCAYDRAAMLAGTAATQHCFQQGTSIFGVLPSDWDGVMPPPAGSPNYFLNFGTNSLNLWKFHVDFTTPANTTLSSPITIPVAAFTGACSGGGTCVPQSGTTQQLDSLADRLMFRLAYRNFGDHESLVVSHAVTANSVSGVRWYEIRSPGATPSVYQQGTFAPNDGKFRWMPSIAMDQGGNIAVGYSISSSSMNPSIAYAGRLSTDTLGMMGQGELVADSGTGDETGDSRWGDYSTMTVDPSDDCTFWYTTEYYLTTGTFSWDTRILSFKLSPCVSYAVAGGVSGQVNPFTLSLDNGAWIKPVQASDTGYQFTGLLSGANYSVGVGTQPVGQTCTVANSTGTIGTSNVTNANVTCKNNYTVTASAIGHGRISPATQTVVSGNTVSFIVTPDPGFQVSTVSGDTCTVARQGTTSTWTTSAISQNCAVTATFVDMPSQCTGTDNVNTLFFDNFPGTSLDTGHWTPNANGGTITVANNSVALSGSPFPYVTAVGSPIPAAGNFSVRWIATYGAQQPAGTGSLAITQTLPANGTGSWTDIADAWQDSSGYRVQVQNPAGTTSNAYSDTAPAVVQHDVEYCWLSNTMEVYVDGALKFQHARDASVPRPTTLWFGNPSNTANTWQPFTLYYVEVRGLIDNTTTTVTASANPSAFGQSMTLTASVSAASSAFGMLPTGTVAFLDGGNAIGQTALDATGKAALTTSTLAAGNHTITARYGGDASFNPSTGALATNPLMITDFSIAVAPTSLSVSQGHSSIATAMIVSIGGFNSATNLTISGLPSGVTALFAPASVTPTANDSATSMLTLTAATNAPVTTTPATVTITGTSGAAVHSATINLKVDDVIFRSGLELDYNPAYCAAVASTLNIYWEAVGGTYAGCSGIENTDGNPTQAKAAGAFSMNGVSVSPPTSCLATAKYSFALSSDKKILSGSDTFSQIPMTLTLSNDGACFTGHWISGADDFIATIWNFAK